MMQGYPYNNQHVALPPGKYMYSNNFPSIMQQLSPTYIVPTEPVYFEHLLMHVGKTIRVVTTNGTLEGKVTGVAIDHLQLTIDDFNYHIRFPQITYFITKND